VVVDPSACQAPAATDAGSSMANLPGMDGATGDLDAMTMNMDAMNMSPYGDTMYNSEGDDDDCKYRVAWTSTPICQGTDATFSLQLTAKGDGAPVTGASPRLEVFLSDVHPAPNAAQAPHEGSPGNYSVGPVRFDASGRWTVRFHFFETCTDAPSSPHGHAAFYLNVP
jgi:hypothetical protein